MIVNFSNYKITLLFLILAIFIQTTSSQEVKNEPQKPHLIWNPSKVEYVASISSRMDNLARPNLQQQKEMLDGRSSKYDVVIGKGSEGDDPLAKYSDSLRHRSPNRTPELVFETGSSNSCLLYTSPSPRD